MRASEHAPRDPSRVLERRHTQRAFPKALLPAKVTARFTLLSGDDWREKLAEEIGEPEVAERLRAYIDT